MEQHEKAKYVREWEYAGGSFKLGAFSNHTDINIITFKKPPHFLKEPLKSKSGEQTIDIGQRIVGLIDRRTSAGFGRLHLKEGFLIYMGKIKLGRHKLVVFVNEKNVDAGFMGYIELEFGSLFFLNYAGAGRIIDIDLVLYSHMTPEQVNKKLKGDQ